MPHLTRALRVISNTGVVAFIGLSVYYSYTGDHHASTYSMLWAIFFRLLITEQNFQRRAEERSAERTRIDTV